MENSSTASVGEDFVDIASMRMLDLRTLAQDEIQCLAQLCGDVPARLQDLVNVIVDKSIFNESAGSRRQTFDRDRVPRNKERRLSAGSATAQLHLALEGAGHSHRDLILHICRQLHISERGDKALYQAHVAQPVGVVVEGNRSMSLKRMARASFTGRADAATTPVSADAAVNGKGMAMEALHRSSKKMKTKEEARRRAAEFQAGAITPETSEPQEEIVTVKIISSGHEDRVVLKNMPKRGAAAGGANSSALDLKSPENQSAQSNSADTEMPNLTRGSMQGRSLKGIKVRCATCSGTFANLYSLRRHTVSTGHALDANLFVKAVRKKKKKALAKSSLRCSCGNTYATPFTLRRHAITNGHTLMTETTPTANAKQSANNEETDNSLKGGLKLGKSKLQTYLSKRSWKDIIRQFKCRHCHRQFIRKKHYVRHLDKHFNKSRKKMGRPVIGVLSPSNEVRSKRIGRPPKLDGVLHTKQEKVKRKRKRPPESLDRRVKSHKEEKASQQMPVGVPSGKLVIITCQECGRVFEEYSRYTGHLSMHARLRKTLVAETSFSTRKRNWVDLTELSSLGYRKLLTDTTGTYLSGLPAKLLFPESNPTTDERTGEA